MPPPTVKPKTKVPARKPRKPAGVTSVHGKPALTVKRTPKNFTIAAWSGIGEGCKIMIYSPPGMGKTSLIAQLPGAVIIGADDGGRLIKNPYTGADLNRVPEVIDFWDVRDALQSSVFDTPDCTDIVVDTITDVHRWAVPYVLETRKTSKGASVENLISFGWRDGYRHWYEAMELLLSDCDRWVRAGKNIIFIAQQTNAKMTNPNTGEDFTAVAPDLFHANDVSILNLVNSWCDHIFRIDYANVMVNKKKAKSTGERAIFIHPTVNCFQKTRTIPAAWTSVGFADKTDASIWNLLDDPDQECA